MRQLQDDPCFECSASTGGQGGSSAATGDRIFPTREAIVRLVGTVLAEQTDEWAEGRRDLGLNVLARYRLSIVADNGSEEVTTSSLPALTA